MDQTDKKRSGGKGSVKERFELFLNKANTIHNGTYDYSKFAYANNKVKGIIICNKHGEFLQSPNNHLKGQKCPRCVCNRKVFGLVDFIEQSNKIHDNIYDYSKFIYMDSHTNGIIICRNHGEFFQIPNKHLGGHGCPKCKTPKGEIVIAKWLSTNGIEYEIQKKFDTCINPNTGKKLKFDFFIKNKNLLIEFDGPQHSKIGKIGNHFMTLEEFNRIRERDSYKEKFAVQNKFELLRILYLEFKQIPTILKRKIFNV